MKKKIIGLFVCLLMISILIIPATAITKKHGIRTASYSVDVPIWEVGDEWTYHFTRSSDFEMMTFLLTYSFSGELTFKVVDDLGDSYVLEAITRPIGSFSLGSIEFKTTIFTSLTNTLNIRKADFGLEHFREILKGVLLLKMGSLVLPVPIQIFLDLNVEIDPAWVLIPFPLYDGKNGNLSSTEFWHKNFKLNLFWGLVPIIGPINNSWPITPIPYKCSQEQITVDAVTFDVYKISAEWTEGSRFESYYAERVGNVVKEEIYIPFEMDLTRYSLSLELKDWSYTP